MKHLNNYYREDVKTGICLFSHIIKGKGRMNGGQFADECQKVYDANNRANGYYFALFREFVVAIETKWSGVTNAQIKAIK